MASQDSGPTESKADRAERGFVVRSLDLLELLGNRRSTRTHRPRKFQLNFLTEPRRLGGQGRLAPNFYAAAERLGISVSV